ncbi:MAG: NADH-quinone oxidoreductase subunit NuoH [Deltaproteobacteria bacterium]|nr:NADH-quinone oxidoreductase subunit NuoH [Deltaproteobacteria bacterium]
MDFIDFTILAIKIMVVMGALLNAVPILVWVERRGSAFIQDRLGPNRVGPMGLLQPVADVIKFIFKEDPIPCHVHRFLFPIAPLFSLIPASIIFAAIPFGDTLEIWGRTITLQIADIHIGILYVLAVGSLGIYGVLIAGWSSNNKYSILGALRSSSQMISYEIALGASLIGPLLVYGTFSLNEIVHLQAQSWGIFLQPLAFLIFFVSGFAESNRLPFDLPEGEAELVAGFHTEYGSMKFALFFMAEYIHIVTIAALNTTLFWGGWQLIPGMVSLANVLGISTYPHSVGLALLKVAAFTLKTTFFTLIFIWVRWTLPRFRYDQLMMLGWKILIPAAFINIGATAVLLYIGWL